MHIGKRRRITKNTHQRENSHRKDGDRMNCESIKKMADKLVKKAGSRNPFVIADDNSINIKYITDFKKLKGMYTVIKRNKFIFINALLPEELQKVVCAHEIGHDAMHSFMAEMGAVSDTAMFDTKNSFEFEANVFAAELLIDDNIALAMAKEGMSLSDIASSLCLDKNIVEIKFLSLSRRGNKINIPFSFKSSFLA